jgi:hypothetical protein
MMHGHVEGRRHDLGRQDWKVGALKIPEVGSISGWRFGSAAVFMAMLLVFLQRNGKRKVRGFVAVKLIPVDAVEAGKVALVAGVLTTTRMVVPIADDALFVAFLAVVQIPIVP